MQLIKRHTLYINKEPLLKCIRIAKEVSQTIYKKEWRLENNNNWIEIRIETNLWNKINTQNNIQLLATMGIFIPSEYEIKPFNKIWIIDIYELTNPENMFKDFRTDFFSCQDWETTMKNLIYTSNKKQQTIEQIKKLLAEL